MQRRSTTTTQRSTPTNIAINAKSQQYHQTPAVSSKRRSRAPAKPRKSLASSGNSTTTTVTTTTTTCNDLTIACAHMTSRGGGLASRPRTYSPGVERTYCGAEKGVNPPGRSGGVRVIACPAGQGSSGEWVPQDGPARDAFPQPRLRNDGGLASYAGGMVSTLGRIDAHSPGFTPTVQLDKPRLLLRGSYMSVSPQLSRNK